MKTWQTVLAVAVPTITVLVQLRGLLTRSPRHVPSERDDGVRVVAMEAEEVTFLSVGAMRRRWRWAAALTVFLLLVALLGLVALPISLRGGLLLLAEAVVLLPYAFVRLIGYWRAQPGEPVNCCRRDLVVQGSFDAVTARLRRAMLERGAQASYRIGVSMSDTEFVMEGGNHGWGDWESTGHHMRVSAQASDSTCTVAIESMNYVPGSLQYIHNHRNVAAIVRALLA
jgi:hypothetical protein